MYTSQGLLEIQKGDRCSLHGERFDGGGADAVGPTGNQTGPIDKRRVAGVFGLGCGRGVDHQGAPVPGIITILARGLGQFHAEP